jgi:hypothetical protein
MNECHTNFASLYKYVFQMCLQCTISVYKTHELWMNTFCMISIIKFWEAKFIMWIIKCNIWWNYNWLNVAKKKKNKVSQKNLWVILFISFQSFQKDPWKICLEILIVSRKIFMKHAIFSNFIKIYVKNMHRTFFKM